MLCQACGKKTATTHIKTIVNGKLTEYTCARTAPSRRDTTTCFPVGAWIWATCWGAFGEMPKAALR